MESENKLKPVDRYAPLGGLLGGIILIIFFAIIWKNYGESTVDKIAGILMAVGALLNFIIWFSTKNLGYFSFMSWQLLMAIRLLMGWEDVVLVTTYRIVIVIPVAFFLYSIFSKRMNWHYNKLLELAAKPVKDSMNGFTGRPYPAGNISIGNEELNKFGKLLAKNLVAFPYRERNKFILVISKNVLWDFLFLRKDYQNVTHISIDASGNMAVNIARKDYNNYKEEITFDHLCESLGEIFKNFIKLYREGKSKEILTTLNNV